MLPMNRISGDSERFCPYDNTHIILAKSFSAHLIKCRENHKGHKMVKCPLDSTHIVPKPELEHHLTECDKKYLLDRESQKRVDDKLLKGNVTGPPIVPDHFADVSEQGDENWDNAPLRSGPTPALFNYKPTPSKESSYGTIHGGDYRPPKEEAPIRIIPNAPAQAAILSNPRENRVRGPSQNTVFNYSLGLSNAGIRPLMGMPISGSTALRMSAPTLFPLMASVPPSQPTALTNPSSFNAAGRGMAGVHNNTTADSGPRFVGRGISKFAMKGNQAGTTLTQSQAASNFTPARKVGLSAPKSSSPSQQFENRDPSTFTDSLLINQSKLQSGSSNSKGVQKAIGTGTSGPSSPPMTEEAISLKKQQLKLQQDILMYQKEQFEQLKEQQANQQMELTKKHELQMLQLQKLQLDEKQRLIQEQEHVEKKLLAKTQHALSLMAKSHDLSGIFGGSGMQSGEVSDGYSPNHKTEAKETWHEDGGDNIKIEGTSGNTMQESLSGLSIQDNEDDAESPTQQSATGTYKTRRKLEKKLKQIHALEQKLSLGHRLSKDEEAKLKLKKDIMTELETLSSPSKETNRS